MSMAAAAAGHLSCGRGLVGAARPRLAAASARAAAAPAPRPAPLLAALAALAGAPLATRSAGRRAARRIATRSAELQAADGLPPGLQTRLRGPAAPEGALAEVLSAMRGEVKTLELGQGFAAARALRKVRRFKTRHAASRSWMMTRGRAEEGVRPLEAFPACADLVARTTDAFGVTPGHPVDLNVIVRRYEPGDWLGRHVDDVTMFGEPVLSVVLEAGGPEDGLRLSLPRSADGLASAREAAAAAGFAEAAAAGAPAGAPAPPGPAALRVVEAAGAATCLRGAARYLYGHEVPPVAARRVSVTWRWLSADFAEELADIRRWLGEGA